SSRFHQSRLPNTGFTQYGGTTKLTFVPTTNAHFTTMYSRNQQDNGRRYDQLLGGDGNLIADLRNLMGDVFYARFDQFRLGIFDDFSVTYSYNAQREERVNQGGNGNPIATIGHEPERTAVHGAQAYVDKRIARNDILFGLDYYHERLRSPAFNVNPVTNAVSARRPRVPDNAKFENGGIYLQDSIDVIADKLRLLGAVRYSAASYRVRAADAPVVSGSPLWPDDSLRVSDWTFRTGIVGTVHPNAVLYANFSRGFRAPHMTDLGTLGITGSGFEIAAPDVAGRNATIGTSADASAVSTGRPVSQLTPETSMTYEFGTRLTSNFFTGSFTIFINDIDNNIAKQTLILPAGAVGTSLGGQLITSQNANGAVFVAAASTPVLARANFDDVRIWGIEYRGDMSFNNRWSANSLFTYLHAADERTGLPPNIEGGTPAPDGFLSIRYESPRRWWVEPYLHAAARQDRLSSLDLDDRRTGAGRSRSTITSFFRNGARARGLTAAGPDATFNTADDILLATGETLLQIQDRVLGVGVNSAPLYRAVPGYVTFNLRGGMRFGERHRLFADFENIGDRNYRGISWGVDAPGRNVSLRYSVSF
ncbi:MAG TPA: TonB-dependent receptor, partial [Terriglobales bacterium]|nr:TonB-dependent receptor [Terriglobales bacterium]